MANQADFPVRTQCRVLQVSTSGFYAWSARKPSVRSVQNAVLSERIRGIHAASDGTYGRARIRAELIDEGTTISRKRVARLMRVVGIRGVSRRRGFVVTTQRDASKPRAPDLVRRGFAAQAANELWVADITYVPTCRFYLPGGRHRCLEPTRGGLVDRRAHAKTATDPMARASRWWQRNQTRH